MKKKLLLVCCTVALVLTACGGGTSSNNVNPADTAITEEKKEEAATSQGITEKDVLGRWVYSVNKDILVLKEDNRYELYDHRIRGANGASTSSSYSVEGNEVLVPTLTGYGYDSEGSLQYDNSGEQRKLIGDGGYFVFEDDYYAGLERFSLGDTISTDGAEVVINTVDFTNDSELKTILSGSSANHVEPGQTYAHINFEVTNLLKQEFLVTEAMDFTLDYNDGYRFSMFSGLTSFIVKPSTDDICYINGGSSTNYPITGVVSLNTEIFDLYIPCADKVAEDTNASKVIYVVLPTENGIHEYAVTTD